MQQNIETYIVDSFTDQPFKGNPAGVCLLENNLPENKMQAIAMELGLSETAFVVACENTKTYTIRYFSPIMEIPLCGHATLAASKVLFEKDKELSTIHFKNIQNLDLLIKKDEHLIAMEFPVYDTVSNDIPLKLVDALGIKKANNCVYNKETNIILLEIDCSEELENLTPNFEKLVQSHQNINGVLVTAKSKREKYDFESRYFWPWSGSNEDPVTGGTHTFLTKYWSKRFKKRKLQSYQCSKRTGFMDVELLSDDKLIIKSEAQIVFKGELRL